MTLADDLPDLVQRIEAFAREDRKKAARNLANAEVFLVIDGAAGRVHPLHWLLHVRSPGKSFGDNKRSNQSISRHIDDLSAMGYNRLLPGTEGFAEAWDALCTACRALGTSPSRRTSGPDWTGRSFFVQRTQPHLRATEIAVDPNELDRLPLSVEGAERQVTRNIRERDPVARRLAEAHWRARNGGRLCCFACGIDFGRVYGPRAEGFMHFHHLYPLGDTTGPRMTDPAQDMVPLCPNCHAVVHLGDALLHPDELRGLMARHGALS
jgi:hypothetical protein